MKMTNSMTNTMKKELNLELDAHVALLQDIISRKIGRAHV